MIFVFRDIMFEIDFNNRINNIDGFQNPWITVNDRILLRMFNLYGHFDSINFFVSGLV